jgi:hypothetical protein
MAHSAKPIFPQWPMAGMTLKFECLGKLESKFQTVCDDESGDQAGAFG